MYVCMYVYITKYINKYIQIWSTAVWSQFQKSFHEQIVTYDYQKQLSLRLVVYNQFISQ